MANEKELEDVDDVELEKEYDRLSKEGIGSPKFEKRNDNMSLNAEQIEIMAKNMNEREAPLEDVFGTEEATAKALIELVRTERINLLTDLNDEEIQMLVTAETIGSYLMEKTGDSTLLNMSILFKEMKVSLHRKGRSEIVGLGSFASLGLGDDRKAKQGLLGLR